jgi:two-component SAPR family response regulator
MKTIIVAEKRETMQKLENMVNDIPKMELLGSFEDVFSALRFVEGNGVDLMILGVVVEKSDSIALKARLQKSNADMMLIYIAGGEEQTGDVISLHPITVLSEDFSKEDLRYAVKMAEVLYKQKSGKIYVRTFGHFDVFVEGQPIMFKSAKAKELLAFLVDRRGGTVTTDQMISVLWENRPNDEATQNLCSKLVKTLRKELQASGAEQMLVVSRGIRRVDTDTFQCDLYELLDGSKNVREQYIGEYLLDYSWSENRTALLDRFLH